jgi:hypothetical protein
LLDLKFTVEIKSQKKLRNIGCVPKHCCHVQKKKTQQNWLTRTGKYGKQKKASQNRLARTGKYEKQKKPAKIG